MNTPMLNAFLEGAVPFPTEREAMRAELVALMAERDEWRDAAQWAEGQRQHWRYLAEVATRRNMTEVFK